MTDLPSKITREPHFPIKKQHLWEYWSDETIAKDPEPTLTLKSEFMPSSKAKVINDIVFEAAGVGGQRAYEQVRDILYHDSIPQKTLNKALLMATQNEFIELAELLLDHNARPDEFNGKAFLISAEKGNIRLFEQYKNKYPDLEALNPKAMTLAAGAGQLDMVQHFLNQGQYAYKDDGAAYRHAYSKGQIDVVELLESEGLTVGFLNSSTIKKAARSGALIKFAEHNPLKFRSDFVVIHKLASKAARKSIYEAFVNHQYKDKGRPLGIWQNYRGILLQLDFASMSENLNRRMDKRYASKNGQTPP